MVSALMLTENKQATVVVPQHAFRVNFFSYGGEMSELIAQPAPRKLKLAGCGRCSACRDQRVLVNVAFWKPASTRCLTLLKSHNPSSARIGPQITLMTLSQDSFRKQQRCFAFICDTAQTSFSTPQVRVDFCDELEVKINGTTRNADVQDKTAFHVTIL